MRLIMVNPNIFIVVIFTTSGMKRLGRFVPIFISHCYYTVRGRGGSRTRFDRNAVRHGGDTHLPEGGPSRLAAMRPLVWLSSYSPLYTYFLEHRGA